MTELNAESEDHQVEERWSLLATGSIVVSIVLHLVALAIFLFGLPEFPQEPEKEPQSVTVALVPPPEEKPKEQAQQPKPEKKAETSADGQPGQGMRIPIPVLKPAFRFGEKDAGPRHALDGDAARKLDTPPVEPAEKPQEPAIRQPTPSDTPKEAEAKRQQQPEALTAAKSDADAETAVASLVPLAPADRQSDASKTETAETDQAKDAAKAEETPDLKRAGKLFSHSETGAQEAMIAAGGIPRSERASRLCLTELREQLRHAEPAYRPELLPAYKLADGTVLSVQKAAFRASGQWFDLSFRCEVDNGATKVVSFAYAVGEAVPREQWQERGFPAF